MNIEGVPDIPMFRQNTAAFIHPLPEDAISNVDGDGSAVRVQVLTNAGALDRDKQIAVVSQFTDLVSTAAADAPTTKRIWVLLTEAVEGGWGLSGHAHTNAELVDAARAQIAGRSPDGRTARSNRRGGGHLGSVLMPSPRKHHAVELFRGLPDHYDHLGAVMSFGQDPRWRRALVASLAPKPGMRILDVATGTGMVAFALAERGATVVGLDQSETMLAGASARLQRTPRLADRMSFMLGEAEALPFADGEFDALSFTYLLRYVDDRVATMRELARVLKPGGRISMVEFGVPGNPRLRLLWRIHTRLGLPLIGRTVSRDWYEVGRFLGPNIERFHTEFPDIPALWSSTGIAHTRQRDMSFGAGIVVTGVRDDAQHR